MTAKIIYGAMFRSKGSKSNFKFDNYSDGSLAGWDNLNKLMSRVGPDDSYEWEIKELPKGSRYKLYNAVISGLDMNEYIYE